MLVFYKSVNKIELNWIEVNSISDMVGNIPPTPTRSLKGGSTPKVTLINQLKTLKTEIFSMQILSLSSVLCSRTIKVLLRVISVILLPLRPASLTVKIHKDSK